MNTATFPMPGALRWRRMHPLIDGDGSCSLIYDQERAAVLEVPAELQLHVAPALETGDLDDDLLSWLVEEDLLTTEGGAGWGGAGGGGSAVPGWGDLWGVRRFDDEVHARIAPAGGVELEEVLGSVFKQGFGVSRVQLLLDWNGTFPGAALLERVLFDAGRLAARARQEISFELVLDIGEVTRPVSALLASLPLHVRLRCGKFPARAEGAAGQRAWESSLAPLYLLLDAADRLNAQCTLGTGARLLDLWTWAKRSGIRRLDVARDELSALLQAAPEPPLAEQVRQYREDLLAIGEEMVSDLSAGRLPIDYRPLTRMLRRLMGSEQRTEPAGDADASPCPSCWARALCNHSTLLAAPVGGDASWQPTPDRCAFWLAECEAALRLYHRLAHCDPTAVLRLLGDAARTPLDPLGRSDGSGKPQQPF